MLYHSSKRLGALLGASAIALGWALPAAAQTSPPARAGTTIGEPPADEDYHGVSDQIVVSAKGLKSLDILAGTSVLQGDDLQRNQAGQLGDVLAKLPGVTSSGFAPGVSRPILRGFSGERVRVMIDGLGTIDASNTSDDHAVAVDTLTTERIEVLRGPAVLLYGSQAIGGAVNVIDKRIPLRPLDKAFHLDALGGYDSVNDQVQLGASLDVGAGENFVFHVDGSWRDAGNLRIPGYVLSDTLRADLLADADAEEDEGALEEAAELRETANRRGELPNSSFDAYNVNTGFAFFAGQSSLGFSGGWMETTYGVPERPGAGHHHGEEEGGDEEEGDAPVSIGLKRFRADMRGELVFGGGFLDRLVTRVGYTNYEHTEFEGSEVGTVFDVEGIEARAEFVQNASGPLRGSFGAQYYYRDFEAIGEEAFVAPNRTDQFGLFALQEYGDGPFQVEGALRYETTSVDSAVLGIDRHFDALSGAIGVSYEIESGLRFGVNGTRVQRAPSGEELFANGPHIATQAFEIGNPDFQLEKAWGLEGYVRGNLGPARIGLTVSQSWFDDYIYLSETGMEDEESELPIFAFIQDDARYFSVEGELSLPLVESERLSLLTDLRGSYVHAELDDGTPIPRIPPLSLLGALEAQTGPIEGRVEVQWFAEQDRVAAFETPTEDFAFVNASLAYKPEFAGGAVTLLAQVDNIFDTEGRRHASFTKDFVPLPGRNFRISARLSF